MQLIIKKKCTSTFNSRGSLAIDVRRGSKIKGGKEKHKSKGIDYDLFTKHLNSNEFAEDIKGYIVKSKRPAPKNEIFMK